MRALFVLSVLVFMPAAQACSPAFIAVSDLDWPAADHFVVGTSLDVVEVPAAGGPEVPIIGGFAPTFDAAAGHVAVGTTTDWDTTCQGDDAFTVWRHSEQRLIRETLPRKPTFWAGDLGFLYSSPGIRAGTLVYWGLESGGGSEWENPKRLNLPGLPVEPYNEPGGYRAVWAPGMERLFVAGPDLYVYDVELDMETTIDVRSPTATLQAGPIALGSGSSHVAVSPDGQALATANGGTLRVHEAPAWFGDEVLQWPTPISTLAWLDGPVFASGDEVVAARDDQVHLARAGGPISALAVGPGGLAVGRSDVMGIEIRDDELVLVRTLTADNGAWEAETPGVRPTPTPTPTPSSAPSTTPEANGSPALGPAILAVVGLALARRNAKR